VLLRALEVLRDLRTARDRQDIPTRHADLAKLRSLVVKRGVVAPTAAG